MTSFAIPPTYQLTNPIQEIREEGSLARVSKNLSPSGRKLAANVEKLLSDIQIVLEEKSPNSELQKVAHYASEIAASANSKGEPVSAASDSASEIARRAASLAVTTVRIPEFRRDVWDLIKIFQELFDIEMELPDPSELISHVHETVDTLSERTTSTLAQGNGLKTAAKQAVDVLSSSISKNIPEQLVNESKKVIQQASQNVDQGESITTSVQKIAKDKVDQVVQKFHDLELSDDQRRRIFEKLHDVIEHVNANKDVRRGFEQLEDSYRDFLNNAKRSLQNVNDKVLKTSSECCDPSELGKSSAELLLENSKKLIENFAGRSLNPFLEKLTMLAWKTLDDQKLASYMSEALKYLKMPTQEIVNDRAMKAGGKGSEKMGPDEKLMRVITKIQNHVSQNYQDEIQAVLFEGSTLMRAISEDEALSAVSRDVSHITRDLYDKITGKPKINLELWPDIIQILPILADKLAYLPLPRIDTETDDYRVILDHIFLKCSGIVPDHIRINTEVLLDKSGARNKATINMSGIQASCKDVAWLYRRKMKHMTWSDVGVMDLFINDGVTIDMQLETAPFGAVGTQKNGVKVNVLKTEVNVDGIKVVLRETRHDFVYKIMRPMINRAFKKKMEEEVEKWLNKIDFVI